MCFQLLYPKSQHFKNLFCGPWVATQWIVISFFPSLHTLLGHWYFRAHFREPGLQLLAEFHRFMWSQWMARPPVMGLQQNPLSYSCHWVLWLVHKWMLTQNLQIQWNPPKTVRQWEMNSQCSLGSSLNYSKIAAFFVTLLMTVLWYLYVFIAIKII